MQANHTLETALRFDKPVVAPHYSRQFLDYFAAEPITLGQVKAI